MNILSFNSGSSSLKFKLIKMPEERILIEGKADNISLPNSQLIVDGHSKKKKISSHKEALKIVLEEIGNKNPEAIGHRVVHGGEYYTKAVKIDSSVLKRINELSSLAPLHNPRDLACIKTSQEVFPKIPNIAVFDTSFHQTILEKAFMYALPRKYYTKYKIRKYGFHGISHKYSLLEVQKLLNKTKVSIISCHLGHGCSVCAIKDNSSIDTSMGFTPLQGLIMATRSGDIDPSIIEFLSKKEALSIEKITDILNKSSGLLGISGYADMRIIHKKANKGDTLCKLAIEMFSYRLANYISSYLPLLENPDAITFTGGIGEGAHYIREKALAQIGVALDKSKNLKGKGLISSSTSKTKVFVIPSNEELMIAREAYELLIS